MRRAKIVATIGPATESAEMLRELARSGLDVARINLSHGEREHHAEVIARVRAVASEIDRPIAVMCDLAGPKIRTGRLVGGGPVELAAGAELRLVADDVEGTAEAVSISYPRLADEVVAGDRILVDDGLIELRVARVEPKTVVARVVNGGLLRERKGVNFPGAKLSVPSITDKDERDLETVLAAGVDYIALSFVRSAEDCARARALVAPRAPNVRLVAKIEKPEAVDDLADILRATDGVMVARGDLGVEAPPESVPIYQKRIIREAIRAEKFVITATQMLQSMVENPRPTRAEASDVANAIFDGTDAVMLSGETAMGRYPVEALTTMDRIVRFTEASRPDDHSLVERFLGSQTGSTGRALAEAALFAAEEIKARTILVFTERGEMARHVASLRPTQQIVALTSSETTYRQLAAVWGVAPRLMPFPDGTDALVKAGDQALLDYALAERGETVVVISGVISGSLASTTIKLHRIGEEA